MEVVFHGSDCGGDIQRGQRRPSGWGKHVQLFQVSCFQPTFFSSLNQLDILVFFQLQTCIMAAWMCLRGRVSEKKNLAERHFDTTAAVFQVSNTLTYAKQLNGKMCSSCFILYSAKNMSQSKRKLVTKNILRYYSNLARVPIHNMVLCKTLLSRCINHTF